MATTTLRRPGGTNGSAPPSRLAPPTSARHRSPSLATLGVLCCFFGALLFGAIHLRLDRRADVLAVARPVAAGQILNAADVHVVRAPSIGGLMPLRATDESRVVGRPAAVSLVPGTLLVQADLGSGSLVGPDQAVVGAALKPGQLPAVLRPGDRVLVVDTGSASQTGSSVASSTSTVPVAATVLALSTSPDGTGDSIVSLVLSTDEAPAVARLAAGGRVSLVLLGSQP